MGELPLGGGLPAEGAPVIVVSREPMDQDNQMGLLGACGSSDGLFLSVAVIVAALDSTAWVAGRGGGGGGIVLNHCMAL